MNSFTKVCGFVIALATATVVYNLNKTEPLEEPEETWWGPGNPLLDDNSIHHFTINVSDEILKDLENRLNNSRSFTPPLEGIQHQYGFNTNLLKEIVNFWQNNYNWKEREIYLNQYPQFKTKIQGLNIHYLHVKPQGVLEGVKVLPLLLLHGWPASVSDFYEMIPLLTSCQKNQDFVFEVIAASLPGYGFSQAAVRPGLGSKQTAVILKNLMARLGFDFYYIQGGDWGAHIASFMASFYPDEVKGIHLNMCTSTTRLAKFKLLVGSLWPSWVVDEKNRHRVYPLSGLFARALLETGYMHLQATKPDTVGVSLNDSPVGLLAYILEKFIVGTNPDWINREDGGLLEAYTYTRLLDNIMIYWITGSITTSCRFYAETVNKNMLDESMQILVPTACAMFDNEPFYQPESILKDKFVKLIQANEYSGGHFAAFQASEALALDLRLAVSKFEKLRTTS